MSDPKRARQAAAIGALVLGLSGFGLAVVVMVQEFPRGLIALGCVALAAGSAWYGVLRRGAARVLGLSVGALGVAAAILLLAGDRLLEELLVAAALVLSCVCARAAFGVRAHLPHVPAPQRPVLFFNPKSGGGKAERFSVAAEARARGIEPIELGPGRDLEQLVRDAVTGGADGLAMAGGDGSQAVVASIAAELDLPYACVPAGTRNHFALDLGVDRDDVVGALDAFVDGRERRVDLAEVNGRVFVNNVSLGLYAEAVQRTGYRDAKLRTILDTVPEVLGPEGTGLNLRWTGPGGHEHASGAAILVSNNRYRLGRAVGSGTRPRIDDGRLGITVLGVPAGRRGNGHRPQRPWREWTTPAFEVTADHPVPAGIDGEAVKLQPPLRFRIRPGVLRVRIAGQHPGASPSAMLPESVRQSFGALARIALARDPAPAAAGEPVPTLPPNQRQRSTNGHLRGRAEGTPHPRGGRSAPAQPRRHARAPQRHRVRTRRNAIHRQRPRRARRQDRARGRERQARAGDRTDLVTRPPSRRVAPSRSSSCWGAARPPGRRTAPRGRSGIGMNTGSGADEGAPSLCGG
jgi:diacylglycerol kinase family enzyme